MKHIEMIEVKELIKDFEDAGLHDLSKGLEESQYAAFTTTEYLVDVMAFLRDQITEEDKKKMTPKTLERINQFIEYTRRRITSR